MRMTFGRWMVGVVAGLGLAGGVTAQDAVDEAEQPAEEETTEMPDKVYVKMATTEGEFVLELNNEKAPISVENFVKYVEDEAYDGTVFHRVISNFMIQGGGFEPDGAKRDTRPGIKNEWKNGLSNEKYTIAMARLGGRADSGTNQFFINVSDNAFLDQPRDGAGYAVFGVVIHGFDTIDKIRDVPTGTKAVQGNPMGDWPIADVVIEKASVMTDEEVEAMMKELEEGSASEGG